MRKVKTREWIDVSVPLASGMVHWPGDPKLEIKRVKSIEKGNTCNVSELTMGAHSGTHMDAPSHFIRSGKTIDTLPAAAVIGAARVIRIRDRESVKVKELRKHRLRRGERILLGPSIPPAAGPGKRLLRNSFIYQKKRRNI